MGKELMILSIVFLAYGLWGEYIPSVLGHQLQLRRMFTRSTSPLRASSAYPGVSSTYIFLFILFGAFLTETGMGRFIETCHVLAGHTIGGRPRSPSWPAASWA